jgi:hypothetical protein
MRYAIGFTLVMFVVSLLFRSGPSREAGLVFWGLLAVILSILGVGWVQKGSG